MPEAMLGAQHDPSLTIPGDPNNAEHKRNSVTELPAVIDGKPTFDGSGSIPSDGEVGDDFPTEKELETLPRVADHINWKIYSIAFVGMSSNRPFSVFR